MLGAMILKDYLRAHSETPAAFAARLNLSVQAVYRYMAGERFPPPDILLRIREATGGAVTADDFLDQRVPTPPEAAA